jgi:hypothetical protein
MTEHSVSVRRVPPGTPAAIRRPFDRTTVLHFIVVACRAAGTMGQFVQMAPHASHAATNQVSGLITVLRSYAVICRAGIRYLLRYVRFVLQWSFLFQMQLIGLLSNGGVIDSIMLG